MPSFSLSCSAATAILFVSSETLPGLATNVWDRRVAEFFLLNGNISPLGRDPTFPARRCLLLAPNFFSSAATFVRLSTLSGLVATFFALAQQRTFLGRRRIFGCAVIFPPSSRPFLTWRQNAISLLDFSRPRGYLIWLDAVFCLNFNFSLLCRNFS